MALCKKITPDCSMFVSIYTCNLANKEYILINVSKEINVYFLKEKGVLKGTYVRNGSCLVPASEETVNQMIEDNILSKVGNGPSTKFIMR